jgi:hypothetical protein
MNPRDLRARADRRRRALLALVLLALAAAPLFCIPYGIRADTHTVPSSGGSQLRQIQVPAGGSVSIVCAALDDDEGMVAMLSGPASTFSADATTTCFLQHGELTILRDVECAGCGITNEGEVAADVTASATRGRGECSFTPILDAGSFPDSSSAALFLATGQRATLAVLVRDFSAGACQFVVQ